MLGVISAIVGVAVNAVKTLAVVGLAVEGLKEVGNAILGIAKALGLIEEEQDVEDLGDRALQAEEEGIKPENFESYEGYINVVKDFEVDLEKSAVISQKDKVLKGTEISYGLIHENRPDININELIESTKNDTFMENIGRIGELGKIGVSDTNGFNNSFKCINGKDMSRAEVNNAFSVLTDIEKKVVPGITDDEAFSVVLDYSSKR